MSCKYLFKTYHDQQLILSYLPFVNNETPSIKELYRQATEAEAGGDAAAAATWKKRRAVVEKRLHRPDRLLCGCVLQVKACKASGLTELCTSCSVVLHKQLNNLIMAGNNKIALVTGGSRGLGRDMALKIAGKGLDVVLTYNSNATEADKVVAEINSKGRKAVALQLNAGDITSFDAFFTTLTAQLTAVFETDHFDFLVNNAGTALYAPFAQTREAQFDDVLNIHYKGVFFLTQKALPLMNDGGGIVNISSGLTRFSYPGSSAYASMKGAIEVLTRYLAKELGSRHIKANIVAPGAIATDFGGGHVRDNKELSDQIASVTALGRVGEANDVGGVVAFLCTEDAAWVTGQRIEVSGGTNL